MGPKLLFAAFIFQSPEKFGLSAAAAVPDRMARANSAQNAAFM
jgi:hypothetical protein